MFWNESNMLQKVIKVAAFNSTNCGDAKKKNLIFVREHSDHATLIKAIL